MISEDSVRVLLKREIAVITDGKAETIDENAHLADIGVDSLQALQLLVLLEREYALTFEDVDLKHFRSINSVVSLVTSRLSAAA